MLKIAEEDAAAAKALSTVSNRNAAYHCQQAAEKLIRVVLLHLEIEAGREHRLDVLLYKVPQPNLWKAALKPLEKYTPCDCVPLSHARRAHPFRPSFRGDTFRCCRH